MIQADHAATLQALTTGRRFVIMLHEFPDGDSIGSSLALSSALKKMGKNVTVATATPLPDTYTFLPGTELVVDWRSLEGYYDTAVLIDCGDLGRVGDAREIVSRAGKIVNIDHHTTNTGYGDINYVDSSRAAAGEIIYLLIQDLPLELDLEISTAIYTALVTDTGSFKYDNTTAETHRLAARLLAAGVDAPAIAREIYENNSRESMMLLGAALSTMKFHVAGQVAGMRLTRKTFDQLGARPEHADGIINYARSIRGVRVAFLLTELESGKIKVGLRSKDETDVSKIAALFGGGGHPKASGFTSSSCLEETEESLLAAIDAALAFPGGR